MSGLADWPEDVLEAAKTVAGNWKRFDSFLWGGYPRTAPEDCAILYLSNRDSDALDKSNESVILEALEPFLGSLDDGDEVETQSHNHWAVGHVDGIVIRCLRNGEPTEAFKVLHALAMRLAEYPILDDDDFSEREQTDADETWKNCYSDKERLDYIRRHSTQFEFYNWQDLLGCVRGKFFAGYASELLG